MLKRIRNSSLSIKISLLGGASVLITMTAMLSLFLWLSGEYYELAQQEVNKLIDADLDHITNGIYTLVRTENESVQEQVFHNLSVERELIASKGGLSIGNQKATYNAVNQFTGDSVNVSLPKMMLGSEWLGFNSDPEVETPIVDELVRMVGGNATIFKRMNEQGDMLRVATNVKNNQGKRAVGTYIPGINPDGTRNEVIKAILSGKPYLGRAYVVNEWYITSYEALRDREGAIIGMIYVGVSQKSIEARVRHAILDTKVGRTGYVYVIGGKYEKRGHYIISQRGERDGENIWDNLDVDSNYVIRSIVYKATNLKPGEMTTERYRWQNPGETKPRWKIARLAYYEPWDWVIGTSVYEDELQEYYTVLTEGRMQLITIMSGAGLAILILIGLLGIIFAMSISRPVRQITKAANEIIAGNISSEVPAGSGDEIGTLGRAFNVMTKRLNLTIEGLRNSEESYRRIIDTAKEGIWWLDEKQNTILVNLQMAQLLGYSIDELAGSSFMGFIIEEDLEDEIAKFDILRKGSQVQYERRLLRKDGQVVWTIVSATPVSGDNNQFSGSFAMFTDITIRKQAEIDLQDSEEHYRTLFESSGDAVFIIVNRSIIRCNAKALEMFHCTQEQIIGKSLQSLSPVAQPNERFSDEMGNSYLQETLDDVPQSFEWVHQRFDGTLFNAEVKLNKLVLKGTVYIQAIIRDITERKRAEAELENARKKAEESDQLKSAFLANMSHEIRTPLNAIMGFSELSCDEDITIEEKVKFAKIIKSRSKDLLNIVSDILDISKIDANQMKIAMTKGSLGKLMEEIYSGFEAQKEIYYRKGHIEFVMNCSLKNNESEIITDFSRIQQIIGNLVSNAFKFTKEGRIEFGCRLGTDNMLLFYVTDTGTGIPEDKRKVIFERFRQADDSISRHYGGTGLGLSISKGLVDLLQGRIWVESVENQGSTFYFTIPYIPVNNDGKQDITKR